MSEASIEARLARVEKELKELKDREAIREVVHRYCQAVDRCDLELLISCYHSDSYDDHGFFAGNGHDFARYVIPVLQQIDSSIHSITNSRIDLSGVRAYCASQWSVVHRLKRKGKYTDFLHDGRYLDIFEKRDGEWKILHRVVVNDMDRWVHTLGLRREELGSVNTSPSGCRGPGDLSYLGFELTRHRPERPPVKDLWSGMHRLSAATQSYWGSKLAWWAIRARSIFRSLTR